MTPASTAAASPAQARRAPSAPKGNAAARATPDPARGQAPQIATPDAHPETPPDDESVTPEEIQRSEPPRPKRPSILRRFFLWIVGQPKKVAAGRTRTPHGRWRTYALGCYGLIVASTLVGQLYSSNPLGVYVKVQRVVLPVSTLVLVRNDSRLPWTHVRIRLNGIYANRRDEIAAGESVPLDLDKAFAITDGAGKVLRRPARNLTIESFTLDCDSGHYETELR